MFKNLYVDFIFDVKVMLLEIICNILSNIIVFLYDYIILLIYLFKYILYLIFKIFIKYCYVYVCFINKLRVLFLCYDFMIEF